ncbi:hypothetical protein D3C83_153260 [compost metagenome]
MQIHSFIPAGPKSLSDAKGAVMSDFQAYLESEWMKTLLAKYPIVVNQQAFEAIKLRMVK